MGISYSNDARQFAVTLHSGQETQQAIHHVMIHDPFFHMLYIQLVFQQFRLVHHIISKEDY
ncbi:hypothetical protein [Bacillus cereus]|uniref:hypothetical protein n=1 Tax=Bacillus cereus TaxID=1396 RepID=UPI00159706B1